VAFPVETVPFPFLKQMGFAKSRPNSAALGANLFRVFQAPERLRFAFLFSSDLVRGKLVCSHCDPSTDRIG
jgi:hypothetical protein